ncbi:hypothetical protein HFV04_015795 [Pseudomonas sp. BIGb0427]|uniref:hypothetical protein n=1 Tax=unclassified Pseudomonas TaxID=196821 RepID=UPI00168E6444|nr:MULTISPECIES: hypothetical protein [unclassified Pseudomonas]NLU59935.1 hypothetical protein [Pseudomonas sp. BIGb0427]QPG61006.1 hypothetical protein HFV04_015795 [Pseudomonas sp. BIGb0427]UVM68613.1 hypothetical protein LOY34_08845 [Pseudomonas sp. B21-009]
MLIKLISGCCLALCCSLVSATVLQTSFDQDARYSIVSVSGDPSQRTVITQRVGISGTSYSARQFDCSARTVRFMGSGASLEDLQDAEADNELTPIFKGSLSRAISQVVCDESVQAGTAAAGPLGKSAHGQPVTSISQ